MMINCKSKCNRGPLLQQSFILWECWKMKLHQVCILITLLNCYLIQFECKIFYVIIHSYEWLIRNSAWWWRKEVSEFSIPSLCIWYFKTVQYVSIFPLKVEGVNSLLCVKDLATIPISVEGMLVLLCRAPSCWLWLESEQEELSYLCCCSAGSGMLQPLVLVPELALLAARLRFLNIFVITINYYIYITLINVKDLSFL